MSALKPHGRIDETAFSTSRKCFDKAEVIKYPRTVEENFHDLESWTVTLRHRLTEVEVNAGADDPASHAIRVMTPRDHSMFGPPGTLYAYPSYGIHWCVNVVAGEIDLPHAVLLRGGVPVRGISTMVGRRGRSDHFADGPGKL